MAIEPDRYYMRDPLLVAVGRRDRFVFCHGETRTSADGVEAAAMSLALERLVGPTLGSDIFEDDAPGARSAIESLIEGGSVLEATTADPLVTARDRVLAENQGYSFVPGEPRCGQLVVGLTGTVISGLIAPFLLSLAYSRFHRQLDIVVTEAARSFVQPELFEYYGVRTWTDAFARREGAPVPHIVLGKGADLVAIMPATAASIARLAGGTCSDLLSLVAIATQAPVVVAPTMNTAMWDNPAVRRNVDQLRADGVYVVEPTFFFEAAELIHGAQPLCGMLGVFWGGPSSLIEVLSAVLEEHRAGP